MYKQWIGTVLLAGLLWTGCHDSTVTSTTNGNAAAGKELLGKQLFFDTNLSSPPGQACASCHDPAHHFTDPDSQSPTSEGANIGLFDKRHTPSLAYALYSPAFEFDTPLGGYVGGLFWDGRASTLAAQAKGPFLEPLEMANPDPAAVVSKVQAATYADLMREIYGDGVFDDVTTAYERIAEALAAYERTAPFHTFDSRFDRYRAGELNLTQQEAYGLQVFQNPQKGNCTTCHTLAAGTDGTPPLFTNFTYVNIGLPANPLIPAPVDLDSPRFTDNGLGGRLDIPDSEWGKFKVPTLRNVAATAPYGHNGVFTTLQEVVEFHNTRDLATGRWDTPEVTENVDSRTGNLGLTDTEMAALLAFLNTLTDGYTPPATPQAGR